MVEEEGTSRVGWLRRSLLHLNLFETDATDERTVQVQRWSTRVYICALILCISILSIQHGLHVEQWIVETKNPSLESYLYLRNRYTDVNCPCSQISAAFGSFATFKPLFHPICSSEFLSQTWIEMLVDEMTPFRYPGDFRAVASSVLRDH